MQQTIRQRRDRNILDNLLVTAEDVVLNKSNNRYRLAAAIVKKSKILGIGINNYKKTHPLQAKFKKHEKADFPCAEISAIVNAKRRYGEEALKGSTIYIARLKWTDNTKQILTQGLAEPCISCQTHIKNLGIKRIIYTNDNSGFTCSEVEN